jgi:hypothetical protein
MAFAGVARFMKAVLSGDDDHSDDSSEISDLI